MPARRSPRTKIHISIPTELKEKLDTLLADPHTGARRHGALSFLITRYLQHWVEMQQPEGDTVFPSLDPKELFSDLGTT